MSFLGSKTDFKLILSSFSAHFRLVGLTAKAHFELIFGSSVWTAEAHFEVIFGSLVRRPKLILSSF